MKRSTPVVIRKLGNFLMLLSLIPFGVLLIQGIISPHSIVSRRGVSDISTLSQHAWEMIFLLIPLGSTVYFSASIVNTIQNYFILRTGQGAEATILQVWNTGISFNILLYEEQLIRLLLEVRAPGQPVFHAETERFIPPLKLPQFLPNAVVQVRYDPKRLAVAIRMNN